MKSKPAQHRLTDRDGDVLNMYHLDDGLYCTVQKAGGAGTSTAGPFTPEQLRAALDAIAPAGSYARTDEDYTIEALRGVIDQAVEDCRRYRRERDGARARAEKAEQERDEAPAVDYHAMWWKAEREREKAERERDVLAGRVRNFADSIGQQQKMIDRLRAAESRPLTPRQNLAALWESAHRPVGGRIPAGTAIITRSDYGNGDVRYKTLEATGRDLPDPGYTLERNYNYGPENGEEYRLLDPPARPEGAEDIQADLRPLDLGGVATPEQVADHLAALGYRKAES